MVLNVEIVPWRVDIWTELCLSIHRGRNRGQNAPIYRSRTRADLKEIIKLTTNLPESNTDFASSLFRLFTRNDRGMIEKEKQTFKFPLATRRRHSLFGSRGQTIAQNWRLPTSNINKRRPSLTLTHVRTTSVLIRFSLFLKKSSAKHSGLQTEPKVKAVIFFLIWKLIAQFFCFFFFLDNIYFEGTVTGNWHNHYTSGRTKQVRSMNRSIS